MNAGSEPWIRTSNNPIIRWSYHSVPQKRFFDPMQIPVLVLRQRNSQKLLPPLCWWSIASAASESWIRARNDPWVLVLTAFWVKLYFCQLLSIEVKNLSHWSFHLHSVVGVSQALEKSHGSEQEIIHGSGQEIIRVSYVWSVCWMKTAFYQLFDLTLKPVISFGGEELFHWSFYLLLVVQVSQLQEVSHESRQAITRGS